MKAAIHFGGYLTAMLLFNCMVSVTPSVMGQEASTQTSLKPANAEVEIKDVTSRLIIGKSK